MSLTSSSAPVSTVKGAPRHRRRRPLIGILSAGVTAILAISGIAAMTSPAVAYDSGELDRIQGTVTLESGEPINTDDVMVTAWRLDEDSDTVSAIAEGHDLVDTDGKFLIESLPIGKYAFEYDYRGDLSNIVNQFDATHFTLEETLFDASSMFVELGEGSGWDASFTMGQGSLIAGDVTDGAVGLGGIPVTLWREGTDAETGESYWGEPYAAVATESNGHYMALALPVGTYAVRFGGANSAYVPEFYQEDSVSVLPDTATKIEIVTPLSDHSSVSAELAPGGSVSGVVKNTSGAALSGIEVTSYLQDDMGDWVEYGHTATATNGSYIVRGLPTGTAATVGFSSPDAATVTYVDQYWKARPELINADAFVLTSTTTKPGFNVAMVRSGSIAGVVSLQGGGFPAADDVIITACKLFAPNTRVSCVDWETPSGFGTPTYDAATGAYKVTGLSAGTYSIRVEYVGSGNFRNEYFSDKRSFRDATTFVVGTGAAVIGKNIQLDPGSVVNGNALKAGGLGVAGATVFLYTTGAGFFEESNMGRVTRSRPDGGFTFSGVEDGEYTLWVRPPAASNLNAMFYGGMNAVYSEADAVPFSVPTGASYEVTLPAGSTIEGNITDRSAAALNDAYVTLYRYKVPGGFRADEVDYVQTDPLGHYEFDALPPGSYAVYAEGSSYGSSGAFVGRYFDGASGGTLGSATPVAVVEGSSQNISFGLDTGGAYTGIVTDGTNPVANVWVRSGGSETYTNASGVFTLTGLDEGPHTIDFDTDGLLSRSFDAPGVTLNAAPVDVGTIALEAPSTINGVVIGIDGKPIRDALVFAYTLNGDGEPGFAGNSYAIGITNASGGFSITDLPTEPVYLFLPSLGTKYPSQYMGGGSDWTQSDPVPIVVPGTTAFREIRLINGATILGTVKNKATGRVIPNLNVDVSQSDANGYYAQYETATTNAKGVYVVPGLEAGSYDVTFNQRTTGAGVAYGTSVPTSVNLPDRATLTVNGSLTPSQKVSGTVTKTGGAKLADVEVTAFEVTDGTLDNEGQTVYTDENGNYSLYLQPGKWAMFFADPERRVSSSFLGGSTLTTATRLVVAKLPLAGRNITLGTATGSLSMVIAGEAEPDPEGYILLERMDGSTVISSEWVNGGQEYSELTRQFPIENLEAGDYRITIYGFSKSSQFGGEYAPLDFTFTLLPGEAKVYSATLGSLHTYDGDVPKVVSGSEPVINGSILTPRVGDNVFVNGNPGNWTSTVETFYYQWLRNGKAIPGATDNVYQLAAGDAGAHISVRLGASSPDYPYANFTYTAQLAPDVLPDIQPVPVSGSAIAGTPRIGSTLTAQAGTWDVPGLTFTYQWFRDNWLSPIPGATASTYKPVAADETHYIGLQVTSHRTGFENGLGEATMSQPITPAVALKATVLPKVTVVPNGWRVTPGTWSPSGATITTDWRVYDDAGVPTSYGPGSEFLDGGISADSTKRVEVVVTASKPGNTTTSVVIPVRTGTSAGYLVAPNDGGITPTIGLPLQADESTAVSLPNATPTRVITKTYQWYRGTTKIAGATKAVYTPIAADLGATLKVTIVISAPGWKASAATPVEFTNPVAPAPTILPGSVTFTGVIGGVPATGRTITAVPSGWTPAPTSYTYQWTRDGVNIAKATKASYVPTTADLGTNLAVVVTGKRAGHTSGSGPYAVGAVETRPLESKTAPSIPLVTQVGVKLTANVGTWDLPPTAYAYQWWVNNVPIVGATAATYTPTVQDLGESVFVRVTAKRAGFANSVGVASNPAIVDPGAAVKASKAPGLTVAGKIVKSVKLGQVIAATAGTWPVAALQLSYQWQVSLDNGLTWSDIVDETKKTLVTKLATAGDPQFVLGAQYRVVVTPAQRAGYLDSPAIASAALKALS